MMNFDRIQRALLISFIVSIISLDIKAVGFFVTGATTALSDVLE